MRSKSRAIGTLIVHPAAALAAAFFLTSASAGQAPPGQVQAPAAPVSDVRLTPEEALALDGAAYSRLHGVSVEEGMRRMAIMAGSQDVVRENASENDAAVSGAYFTHAPEFQFVIRLTGTASRPDRSITIRGQSAAAPAATLSSQAQRLGLQPAVVAQARQIMTQDLSLPVRYHSGGRAARRSVRDAISRNFDRYKAEFPTLQGVGYDEARQVVVLQVLAADRGKQVSQALVASTPVPIEIEVLPAPIEPAAARGGTTLYWGGTNSLACTAGFIGLNASGVKGIVTAGHCFYPGYEFDYIDAGQRYRLIIGSNLRRNDAAADIMYLGLPGTLSSVAEFYGNRNEGPRALTGRRTISSTNATVTDNVAQGTTVCFYGMRTGPTFGQSCGDVTHKGYADGGGAGYKVQIKGTMTCNSGDSGAPVFAWNTAFGIVNGCSPLATSAGQTTYMTYTSTDALYVHGYSLAY